MFIHTHWLRFKFDTSREVTEAEYLAARGRPDEFRRSVRAQLRSAARQAAWPTILFAILAAGCIPLIVWLDGSARDSVPPIVGTILAGLFVALAISVFFTACSFLYYAVIAVGFWRDLLNTAHDCASYPDFLAAWNRRQQAGIGAERKLPWWLWPPLLAGVLLVAYYFLCWYLRVPAW